MYSPVLSLPILQCLAHHLTLKVIVDKMEHGATSVKLKSSVAKQNGRRPVKPNRKIAGSLRAIKGKGHFIHRGRKVFAAPASCYMYVNEQQG